MSMTLNKDRKSYIHFIRHGLTEGNTRRWYYGWTDLPLLPEGVEALKGLRDAGIYPPLADADCYTSGMLRTEQTFQTIYGDVPHEVLPLMKEMNFGLCECRTFDEMKTMDFFDDWINDRTGTIAYPEGDSVETFHSRIRQGLKELLGYHRLKELSHRHDGQDAISILVCHGGVIAACMETMFSGERANFWEWIPDPGHGYTVYFKDSEPERYDAF